MTNVDKIPVITIDGPSGTGKGTICHLLAKHLHWNVLDSGAIYRVLAYAAELKGIEANDTNALAELAHTLDLSFRLNEQEKQCVLLNGKDVTEVIRSENCGQLASTIAAIPKVRDALLERQRAFAEQPGLVTDGRDMGTVVFPDAFLKIFLYATEEERASRRYLQLKKKENHVSLAQVVEELAKRDSRDTQRAHAPLKAADDAVIIDTTKLSVTQVFDRVMDVVGERLNDLNK